MAPKAKTSDKLKDMLFDLVGPSGGVARGFADGLDYWDKGDSLRALESALPKAGRDMVKAGRYGAGGLTSGDGIIRVHGEEFSIVDLMSVAMGFKPSVEGRVSEKSNYVYARQTYAALRASLLAKQMLMAKTDGDSGDVSDVQARIDKFNEANPSNKITAQRITTAIHAKENKQRIADLLHGVGFNNKDVALVKELGLDY